MDLQENCPAPQDSLTVLNSSEMESNDGTDPKTVLYILRRKTCDEGLRHEFNMHIAQGRIFGSLEIRGAYIFNSMEVVSGDLSTSHPKGGQILRRTLAQQALQRWDKSTAQPGIPGAKEELAFVKCYEDMVRSLQHQEHDPEMENFALRDAQALDPERFGKLKSKFSTNADNSQNEAWRKQVPKAAYMNANSVKPRDAALPEDDSSSKNSGIDHVFEVAELAQLPSKRKRPSKDEEDAQTLNTEINELFGSFSIYGNTVKDKMFESAETATKESEVEEGVVATTNNMGPFRFLSGIIFLERRADIAGSLEDMVAGKTDLPKLIAIHKFRSPHVLVLPLRSQILQHRLPCSVVP